MNVDGPKGDLDNVTIKFWDEAGEHPLLALRFHKGYVYMDWGKARHTDGQTSESAQPYIISSPEGSFPKRLRS